MRESIVREVLEKLVRTITSARGQGRAPRLPRALRPHAARSTYRPVTDVEVIRRLAASPGLP